MNIKGITARKPDEVESALDELFNTEGPALLSVFTDDEALAMPPRLDFDQVKGYSKFMSKKLMDGDFDEILQLVKKDLGYLKDALSIILDNGVDTTLPLLFINEDCLSKMYYYVLDIFIHRRFI